MEPAVLTNLCPSSDLPAGAAADAGESPWTFQFSIFNQQGCQGTQLNTQENNFTCFDTKDLLTQALPNGATDTLNPGANSDTIVCTTENASKSFDFLSCSTICQPDAGITGSSCTGDETRLACGCTESPDGTCSCGDAGTPPLEEGCVFETPSCDIVCSTTADGGARGGSG